MSGLSREKLYYIVFLIAFICAILGIVPRIKTERMNKNFAFAVAYEDVSAMASYNSCSVKSIWDKLQQNSVLALAVREYTGEEISKMRPMGAELLPYNGKAAIVFPVDFKYRSIFEEYLEKKIPGIKIVEKEQQLIFVIPQAIEQIYTSSIMPDFEALEFSYVNNIPVLFRLGQCAVSDGRQTADALKVILNKYTQIKNILPFGVIIAGNPDTLPIANLLKRHGISIAQIEFFKQIGDSKILLEMYPDIIPLHSLIKSEMIARRVSRTAIIERYVRAVHERSVRIVLVRPYDLMMGNKFNSMDEDLTIASKKLADRGYTAKWPEPYQPWDRSPFAVLALSIVFVSTLLFYSTRLSCATDNTVRTKEIMVMFAAIMLVACMCWKIKLIARVIGGLCAGLVATEAALCALKGRKKFLQALCIVFTGGLTIAAFYGTTKAALRLTPFSGVKLTLLIPLVLVLWHDMHCRIHDESGSDFLKRYAVWAEIILCCILLCAMLVMTLRSDNVSDTPAIEMAFRDFLERILVIRPRTKEVLIGYPALVVYYYMVKFGYIPHYREILRIVATIAFGSAINTFCHFHTRLELSVIRVINGCWLGLIIGCVLVLILHCIIKITQSKKRMVQL